MKIRKVVIPVAGLGTRGLPFTKEVPKEMLPIIDIPTIQFVVEEVIQSGIEQVIFVTSKGKVALEDYFDPSPRLESWLRNKGKTELADKIEKIGKMVEVISVRQKEPLGLGHAILCAENVVGKEDLAVCLGDEIFPPWGTKRAALAGLVKCAAELKSSVVGVMDVPKADTPNYGVIDIGGKKLSTEPLLVTRTVEKPKASEAPSSYAVIGRYAFQNQIFEALKEVRPGAGGEIQLTDGMDALAKAGKLHACLVMGPRYDIGNHLGYLKAQIDFARERPELSDKVRQYLSSL